MPALHTAIHWNGQGPGTTPGTIGWWEAKQLSPAKYERMRPWYAQRQSGNIIMNCNDQAVVDQDIKYANMGGLTSFAYLLYGTQPDLLVPGRGTEDPVFAASMNGGYLGYLNSPNRNLLQHWLIMEGYRCGFSENPPASDWPVFCKAYVKLFTRAGYQTFNGRPLLGVLDCTKFKVYAGGNTASGAKAALDLLRAEAQAIGLGNPYVICLDGGGVAAQDMGVDCYSRYYMNYTNADLAEHPYSVITTSASPAGAEPLWLALKNGGSKMIPWCTAGFDYSARVGTNSPYVGGENNPSAWITNPTTAQWLAHAAAGHNFVANFPASCESGLVLHYAWNEFTEGGFLCPHAGDNFGDRLRALAQYLGLPAWAAPTLATGYSNLLQSLV